MKLLTHSKKNGYGIHAELKEFAKLFATAVVLLGTAWLAMMGFFALILLVGYVAA